MADDLAARGERPQRREIGHQNEIAMAKSADAFVDKLLFTQFADKVTILKKSPPRRWPLDPFKTDMRRIEALRNKLAHGNEYAANRDTAEGVCETVKLMDHWIEKLTVWSPASID